MLVHTGKKVICIKDIHSNLIEEAIFILKTNDKEPKVEFEHKTKEIILEEAEGIISDYVVQTQIADDNEEDVNLKKLRQIKFETCYIVALLIIVCVCISIVL